MKVYQGSIKLNDVAILDQCIKLNNKFIKSDLFAMAVKYGGYSIIDDDLIINYSEYGKLDVYDNNAVKLILPPEVDSDRVNHIIKALQILKVDNPVSSKMLGGWIDSNNELVEELNTIISFNSGFTSLRWNHLYCLMKGIKLEFKQESMAIMFNDSLLLI